jgi:DNA mismatch endonuclease (patch repair protein)
MAKIRSKGTKAEKLVFRELRNKGIYFQKHYSKVIGCPDIALPKKKKAVFIDGDFWHGYQFAKLKKRLPKKYWLGKIERNVKRDRKYRAKLRRQGWKVFKVWEHDVLKNIDKVITNLVLFLK